jgi:hypothetical protein
MSLLEAGRTLSKSLLDRAEVTLLIATILWPIFYFINHHIPGNSDRLLLSMCTRHSVISGLCVRRGTIAVP